MRLAAAGSLRAALAEVSAAFAAAPGGGPVEATHGASGLLRGRIEDGEPFEVFASANMEHPEAIGLVLVARALAQEAACLVLDEPTASLDFGNQALVLRQVRDLAVRDGLAVLMTTHHPDHAFLVADSVAVLHRGTLAGPWPARRPQPSSSPPPACATSTA